VDTDVAELETEEGREREADGDGPEGTDVDKIAEDRVEEASAAGRILQSP